MIDVYVFMNLWFVEKNVLDFLEQCFDFVLLIKDWYVCLKEFNGQVFEEISGVEVVDIVYYVVLCLKFVLMVGDLCDL